MKKLTIKNYKQLIGHKWIDKNFIENIVEHDDSYSISVWRDYMRKHVQLKRTPEDNGDYIIGRIEKSSMYEPYLIRLNEIQNVNVFLMALMKITDYWKIKHII